MVSVLYLLDTAGPGLIAVCKTYDLLTVTIICIVLKLMYMV